MSLRQVATLADLGVAPARKPPGDHRSRAQRAATTFPEHQVCVFCGASLSGRGRGVLEPVPGELGHWRTRCRRACTAVPFVVKPH